MLTPAVRRALALVLACSACPFFEQRGSAQAVPEPAPPAEDAGVLEPMIDPDGGVPEELAPDAAIELAPAEPAPPTTGVIEGTVTSLEDGAPVAAAKVYVQGEPISTETGIDGRFSLTLPPGVHRVSIIHGFHETQTADIEVVAGQIATATLQLTPAQLEYADFLVTAPRIKGTVASVLEERRESAAVVDAISVADISRSPDGTASAATRRIVGATIVGGQYLYVRGLGGRYVNVRLNGVPLPSTDPDLPGFQLDLFPASLLSSLNIAKTFTPDIPGDFAGGSMNVVTRDFPDDFTLTASVGLGTTTETLGNRIITYDGGDTDFLGFDDGTRALPESVENQHLVKGTRRDPVLSNDELDAIGRDFPRARALEERGFFPNTNVSLSVGGTAKVAGRRLGILASLGYRYSLQASNERLKKLRIMDDEPVVEDEWVNELGTEKALIGALGAASYELAPQHTLGVVSMFTQSGEDKTTAYYQASSQRDGNVPLERGQLRFIERQLLFNQLLGHHDFEALVLDWQLSSATVTRDQPNTYDVARQGFPGETTIIINTGSGERLFSEFNQQDLGGGLDLTVPVDEAKLKAGYMGRFGDRDFSQRTFTPDLIPRLPSEEPNEVVFAPGSSGIEYRYEESTRINDAYVADEQLHAGYAMIDTPTLPDLRLIAGARIESMHQFLDPGTRFALTPSMEPNVNRTTTDVLPSAALTYSLTETMSVRAAYGGTVARPVVRELALVYATDYVRKRSVIGSPSLLRTLIHNFDLRWELFPSDEEVLAASVFYKIFKHPIESILYLNGDYSFSNVDGADNYGLELEARIGLDRIADGLEDLSVGANFALIQSNVELTGDDLNDATSASRPMAGQSPYVANVSLGYASDATGLSLNVFYNVFGPRLKDVGTAKLPDTYEQPFHSLDFSAAQKLGSHFTLSASVQNILLQNQRVKQGDIVILEVEEGLALSMSLGFKN